MDGLDQAKTRFPRNLESSKNLSNLWRPQIHLVGVIIWGVPCHRGYFNFLFSPKLAVKMSKFISSF